MNSKFRPKLENKKSSNLKQHMKKLMLKKTTSLGVKLVVTTISNSIVRLKTQGTNHEELLMVKVEGRITDTKMSSKTNRDMIWTLMITMECKHILKTLKLLLSLLLLDTILLNKWEKSPEMRLKK